MLTGKDWKDFQSCFFLIIAETETTKSSEKIAFFFWNFVFEILNFEILNLKFWIWNFEFEILTPAFHLDTIKLNFRDY
jgi:hypothetical protein